MGGSTKNPAGRCPAGRVRAPALRVLSLGQAFVGLLLRVRRFVLRLPAGWTSECEGAEIPRRLFSARRHDLTALEPATGDTRRLHFQDSARRLVAGEAGPHQVSAST